MKVFNKIKFAVLLLVFFPLVVLTLALFATSPKVVYAATTRIDLGTADNFAILGGAAVTGTGINVVTGNVGLSPNGGTAITALTCSEVTGTIYDTNGGYTGGGGGSKACLVTDSGLLTTARNNLSTAYTNAAGRTAAPDIATDLGGVTLTDGVYHAASGTFEINGGKTLTLDGGGNADAVFIFKMASTLTTSTSSKVVLTGSAQACNVYWQVGSSATLGDSSTLVGNVLAYTSITANTGSTVDGRLLAASTTDTSGAVTILNNTTITKKTCAAGTAGAPTPTPTTSSSSSSSSTSSSTSSSSSSTSTPVCVDTAPTNNPNLFQIDRAGSSAVLHFTPTSGFLTYYYIAYGLSSGSEQYGVSFPAGYSSGAVSFTINDLNPNATYYFKVRAGNGCAPGGWSNNKESNSKNPSLPNTGFAPHEKSI